MALPRHSHLILVTVVLLLLSRLPRSSPTYIADANSGVESFTGYGKTANSVGESFKSYGNHTNSIMSAFINYGDKANSATDTFDSYGLNGNTPQNTFRSYSSGSNGGADDFKGYRDNANVGDDSFTSYANDANGATADFQSYGKSVNPGSVGFKGYGQGANPNHRIGFTRYNGDNNTLKAYSNRPPPKWWREPGKFFRERDLITGNRMPMPDISDKMPPRAFLPRDIAAKMPFAAGADFPSEKKHKTLAESDTIITTFDSYGLNGNTPQNNFRSYSSGSNGGADDFKGYRDNANVGDDSFTSYANDANGTAADFQSYGKSVNPGSVAFKGYGQGANPNHRIGFTRYTGDNTIFKAYSNEGVEFKEYQNMLRMEVSKVAANLSLSSSRNHRPPPKWSPKPGKFFRERDLITGHRTCRVCAVRGAVGQRDEAGETKRCATSAEDMLDFAVEMLWDNVAVRSTESAAGSSWDIRIGRVAGVAGGHATRSVSCHQSMFPYLVYYCHSVPSMRVYEAEILATDSGWKINRGVAICHLDTSDWSPGHGAFAALGGKPGEMEQVDYKH
uniref:Uncharacterized protein n=1 Tax=Aegilops tauschii TaxID=37682 RepID=M8BXT2_AEGTA